MAQVFESQEIQEQLNVPAKELPKHLHRKNDFRESFHWRVFRIMAEFVEGFQFLADFRRTVTFFGSARFGERNEHYQEAVELARMLAEEGFTIITGGGPGIMEAANRGAAEATQDYQSVGLNIELEEAQRQNRFVQRGAGFHYFFTRKVMMAYSAQAYVFFPGGLGTLDEFFEIVTLIQTKKVEQFIPVVLVGKDFWEPLTNYIDEMLLKKHATVDKEDTDIYTVVSSVKEAFEIVKNSQERTELYAGDNPICTV